MKHTITLIPGDGIGPGVSKAVKSILAATGLEIEWEESASRAEIERRGIDFMHAGVLESIRESSSGEESRGCAVTLSECGHRFDSREHRGLVRRAGAYGGAGGGGEPEDYYRARVHAGGAFCVRVRNKVWPEENSRRS